MGSTEDLSAPLMPDLEAALGLRGEPPSHPHAEQATGFVESAKRVLREMLTPPARALATVVDVITLCAVVGSIAGLLYLALAGRRSGSVCYPSNPGLPKELQAILLIVPWGGIILGLCFFSQHRESEAPLCSFSTVTLLQIYVMVLLSVWLVGCLSEVSMKICFLVALTFGGIATVLWAWSHGCAEALAERVMGRTGRRDRAAVVLE